MVAGTNFIDNIYGATETAFAGQGMQDVRLFRSPMSPMRVAQLGHREAPTYTEIISEYQHLKAGDSVLDGPSGTAFFTVAAIESNQYLVYHSNSHLRFLFQKSIRENPAIAVGGEFTWAFYLQEASDATTRLIMRTRGTVRPW